MPLTTEQKQRLIDIDYQIKQILLTGGEKIRHCKSEKDYQKLLLQNIQLNFIKINHAANLDDNVFA